MNDEKLVSSVLPLRRRLLRVQHLAGPNRLIDQVARRRRGAPLFRQVMITPRLLVGGQHYPRGWPTMLTWGVTAVVNMRIEFDDVAEGIGGERHLHLPTVDNTPSTLAQIQQGVDFIRTEIEQGGMVYVHCGVGVGRAPTMAVAYLVSTGLSPLKAWLRLLRVRPFIWPMASQVRLVDLYAAQLAAVLAEKQPAMHGKRT